MSLGIVVAAAFMVFGDYRFTAPFLMVPPLWCAALWISGPLAARINVPRLGNCCEALALIYAQGIAICLALPMLAAISGPLADDLLIRLDHAFGLDWRSYVMSVRDYPTMLLLLRVAYTSFVWQPALIIITLFLSRQDERAWKLVNASALALVATVAIFAFFPALGGFIHYGITQRQFPIDARTPWNFGPAIVQMKAGTKLITPSLMVGYVSFPSYHAAAALLLSLGAWTQRWLRWPIILLNIGVVLAAPIYGAHYFVDLIGGFAIAAVAFATASLVRADKAARLTLPMPRMAKVS